MTHNDERIPFENDDNNDNDNNNHHQNIQIDENISDSNSNNHHLDNRSYSEDDFSDIRLSASNNKTTIITKNNFNNNNNNITATTTTTTASTTGEIEMDDINQHQYNGAIIGNGQSSEDSIDNHEEGASNENQKMLDKETTTSKDSDSDSSDGITKPKILDEMDEPAQPIPRHIWIKVLLVYYAVFSDGLSLTLIQPFLPQILEKRWGFEPADVGYVSGILVGVYSFARFGSGFYLGHFSDKYGRKPFLVMSLFVTGIGTVLFALMPNVWFALGLRMIEGLFSNTTALCQATLADMVDKKNRAAVFAYLGGTYALSRCISSSMGGFIVKIFEGTSNPYLYPCIIGGGIVLLSSLLILVAHPETHPKYTTLSYDGNGNGKEYKTINQVTTTQIEENNKSTTTPKEPPKKDKTFKEGMQIILKDRGLLLLMVVGGLNSFNNGGLLLSLVLFSSAPTVNRGLGLDSMGSGIIFTILGFFGFLWQILLFKKVSGRFGLKRQYTVGMILLSIGMALFPLSYVAWNIQGYPLVWVTIGIVVPIISVGFMSGLPIVQGMVANCSNPEIQGLTQGSTQSINSMLRSFGPAISGAIFSASTAHSQPWVLFIVLSIIYVCVAIVSLYLPDTVDINHKALKQKRELRKNNSN
ncbi:hypothetical protein DDB_G0287843 [Dictyostelium discoideum AX4]|uniref:Major facilitator superfamily (MFS) profile domain-containing protein n=1 Tax=Dictyostelium discoideum TaxID=44689 RepID=Q54JQ8_DICDI|nr:hypothetical protein DDB_G0287843 [Dictyostelium discoideum AX4]EAL63568.1 hypothetical protein DDB_G0287843 [Dictyostelium discoideum AX4]|eukprot:XP_637094.1 hypothetical protein DDB_G0287843 [Dictyostelium discoideum AX4]